MLEYVVEGVNVAAVELADVSLRKFRVDVRTGKDVRLKTGVVATAAVMFTNELTPDLRDDERSDVVLGKLGIYVRFKEGEAMADAVIFSE